MAGHLKRYGKYWVFAAMTAAGAYVWDSSRRDLDGRSFAEAFNAAAERALVPALSGDETPDWDAANAGSSNLFPSAALTQAFVQRLASLSGKAFGVTYSLDSLSGTDWTPGVLWVVSTNLFVDAATNLVWQRDAPYLRPWQFGDYDYGAEYAETAMDYVYDGPPSALSVLQDGTGQTVHPDVPKTNQPVYAMFSDAGVLATGTNAGFAFSFPAGGHFWPTGSSARAFVAWRADYTNRYDRVFRRRDLTDAAGILTNLKWTASVVAPGWTFTNKLTLGFDSGFEDGTIALDSKLDDAWAGDAEAPGYVTSGEPEWSAGFQYEVTQYVRKNIGFSDSYFAWQKATKTPEVKTAAGRLPYPAVYAVTNGYVSEIRVFAVMGWTAEKSPSPYHYDNGDPGPTGDTVTGAYVTGDLPGSLSGFGYDMASPGSGNIVARVDTEGVPASYTGDAMEDKRALWYMSSTRKTPSLVLLKTITEPDAPEDLDWSSIPLPEMGLSQPPFAWDTLGFSITDDPDDPDLANDVASVASVTYDYGVAVRIKGVLVLVSWKWKHLDPSNPYTMPE